MYDNTVPIQNNDILIDFNFIYTPEKYTIFRKNSPPWKITEQILNTSSKFTTL